MFWEYTSYDYTSFKFIAICFIILHKVYPWKCSLLTLEKSVYSLGGAFCNGWFIVLFKSSHWWSAQLLYPLLKVRIPTRLIDLSLSLSNSVSFGSCSLGLCCYIYININIYSCVFLINWNFYHYKVLLLVSTNNFCLKINFVWYEYSHPSSLLVTVYIIYFFPSFNFQPMCVFKSKMYVSKVLCNQPGEFPQGIIGKTSSPYSVGSLFLTCQ